jgi:hypothetical protein
VRTPGNTNTYVVMIELNLERELVTRRKYQMLSRVELKANTLHGTRKKTLIY